MSTDRYLSWEDLLAEEQPEEATQAAASSALDGVEETGAAPEVPANFELPEEIRALLAEKERLEQELKQLTGEAEPSPEDERMKRMFPVKAHTKESRIEERRLRLRDELRRMQEKQVLENRRIVFRMDQRREELKIQLRRNEAEERLLRERWARERHAALRESIRRRALETAWQARREALHESRIEQRVRDNRQDEHAFEAARDAARQRALEQGTAAAPADDDWRGRAFDDSRHRIEKSDEHRERLRQCLLARAREQRELEEAREAQRRAAVGEAIARFKEARSREDDRESRRQLILGKKHQERLQAQRSARRGRV